ncbi:MAG TPA: hypothetical protein VH083_24920, partial [Myxococcales bacterium]|nr:hypothetical protein [Myxococcales bacterium]
MRQIALTAISIATLVVLATGASCATAVIGGTAPRATLGPNQACDLCHDAASNTNVQLHLWVFVPGQPLMDDYVAAEAMLQGASSTAMGFSSPGCVSKPVGPVHTTAGGLSDAGVGGASVNGMQPGPPPPRFGVTEGTPVPPTTPGMPDPTAKVHQCSPAPGAPSKNLCAEPLGANGILQPDGVVY